MNNVIFISICGVKTFPGDSKNWTGKFVTNVSVRTPYKAEKIEYYCSFIGRAFGQKDRVEKLQKTLEFYRGWDIILVGHSNGCAILLEMFKNHPDFPKIKHLHLVCGACEADFDKNGLNDLIKNEKIEKVTTYTAGKDKALILAKSWLGKLLKYKTLGLHGGEKIDDEIENKVNHVWKKEWKEYGHSTCWNDENFDKTMDLFINSI